MIYKPTTLAPTTGIYAVKNGVLLSATAAYIGDILFWQLVRSCYGKGYWIPEKPWLDNDTWKDNR